MAQLNISLNQEEILQLLYIILKYFKASVIAFSFSGVVPGCLPYSDLGLL